MKKFIVLLLFAVSFMSCSPVWAAEARFSWSPNAETSLAGYKIYYGTASKKYTLDVDQKMGTMVDGHVEGSVGNLTVGTTYYFAATAYDVYGYESDYSTEVKWVAHDRIVKPINFYVNPEKKVTISVSP